MTDHKWNPTASALCSCGESPNGYSLPTDSAQWMKWEVWHREHLEASDVQMTATDSERDERMQRLAALTVADAGSNAMTVLAKDVRRWLDTIAEQAATIERVREVADTWVKHSGQRWSCDNDDVRASCADVILDALGSQRTEGQ